MSATIHQWLDGLNLPSDVSAALQRLRISDDVHHIAVMPDVHLASEVCVGTVMATSHLIYPNAVGGDIGCGMAAVAFDANAKLLSKPESAAKVLAGLYRVTPSNRHRTAQPLPELLQNMTLSDLSLEKLKHRDGAVQLGTLGRGNHFVEFQKDADDQLWLMIHSGSRAMGQAIRDLHLRHATAGANGLKWLDSKTDSGKAYLADANWAVEYARANRRAMIDAIQNLMMELFGVSILEGSYIDCDHNHVRPEAHFGRDYFVHRKGAAPAGNQVPGIIPGSMGTRSYHTMGRGNAESLSSSSHGAGRLMARSEARRRIATRDLFRQLGDVWFDHRMASRICDEAPRAYKDIDQVMKAQADLTRITRRLQPVLNYKGG